MINNLLVGFRQKDVKCIKLSHSFAILPHPKENGEGNHFVLPVKPCNVRVRRNLILLPVNEGN
jgi:hypothetical protein